MSNYNSYNSHNTNNSNSSSIGNAVFYAEEKYHPIQSGSIDGTDILPHDNAVYRALLCSNASLYDPFGDPKVLGEDPFCTLFVGRLSRATHEDSLRKAMSRYGRVKNLRLVRDIVTGASRGYAFVEYETEREMRRAYEEAHHSFIDDSEIMVDYNRQQLMPGWIPRRLGGGLGGKKESGQLRFGGRERPFRAPLRPIPYDGLKMLGIPPPPEGRYMSRYEIPPPPRRKQSSEERLVTSPRRKRNSEERRATSPRRKRNSEERREASPRRKRNSEERRAASPRRKRISRGSEERKMSPHRTRPSKERDSETERYSHQREKRRRHSHRSERSRSRERSYE